MDVMALRWRGTVCAPMLRLVVDVAHATDIPICSKTKHGDVKLGGGPVIGIGQRQPSVLIERLRSARFGEGTSAPV